MDTLLKPGNFPNTSDCLAELRRDADQQLAKSKAQNTRRAYGSDLHEFALWCESVGLEFLPACAETVRLYCSAMDTSGLKPATISRRLSSIAQAHKLNGHESPVTAVVLEQVKAIRRERGTVQRKAKPLLVKELRAICDTLKPDVLDTRDRALLLVGWAAALRRSEIVELRISDLEFCDEGMIVTLRRSKTDQEGEGQKIGIPILPVEQSRYCAVHAVRRWIGLARLNGIDGPIFRAVGKHGKNVFVSKIGEEPLYPKSISNIVKRRVASIGCNADLYSAHSLRSGWSTEAARIGLPIPALMQHTRHKSEKVALGYISESNVFRVNPLEMLLCV